MFWLAVIGSAPSSPTISAPGGNAAGGGERGVVDRVLGLSSGAWPPGFAITSGGRATSRSPPLVPVSKTFAWTRGSLAPNRLDITLSSLPPMGEKSRDELLYPLVLIREPMSLLSDRSAFWVSVNPATRSPS